MHQTAITSDSWTLVRRGTDRNHGGQEMCEVKHLRVEGTVCVYRLVKYPNGWRNVGQFIPSHFNHFRPTPERRGVKLSNSRIDLTLASFAEAGHGNLYV